MKIKLTATIHRVWDSMSPEARTWAIDSGRVPSHDDVRFGGAAGRHVETYVSTYNDDTSPSGVGACDIQVRVYSVDGDWWVVGTTDDSGGEPDLHLCGDDLQLFSSFDRAAERASEIAQREDEGDGQDADAYIAGLTDGIDRGTINGAEDPEGEYALYWDTVGDDSHVVARYRTFAAASAAVRLRHWPPTADRTQYLCGYSVRRLSADGRWGSCCDEGEY